MVYQGPENIYWLFSSSAQSIAALIGFITAGYYFVLGRVNSESDNDPTLEEINQEIQRYQFVRVKILCALTAISLISSLLLVYFNGLDFNSKNVIVVIVFLINVATILWAISFVVGIIDPNKINKAAKRLIKDDVEFIGNLSDTQSQKVNISEFVKTFITFENLVRLICSKFELSSYSSDFNKTALSALFRTMYQRGLVDNYTFDEMNEVNKIRNLALHGKISMVDKKVFDMLLSLMESMIVLENKN